MIQDKDDAQNKEELLERYPIRSESVALQAKSCRE
jgi:hypothetical protein